MTNVRLRGSEWVVAGFFAYATALLASPKAIAVNLIVGIALFFLPRLSATRTGATIRDWLPLALLPIAYWEMGWAGGGAVLHGLQRSWLAFDRFVLHAAGLQSAIESLGPAIPALLELSYLLVYPFPPLCLAVVYAAGRRETAERFLFEVMLATLLCYALYPWFPVHPPRFAFPGEDAPNVITFFRELNWRFLGNYASNTNVFPSGHVTAAYACAYGLFRALPRRRSLGWTAFGAASLIAIATVYGRYHYAVDALAGFAIATSVYAAVLACERLAPSLIATPEVPANAGAALN